MHLACARNYFNPEILIHRVFLLCTHGKKRSMAVYEMESYTKLKLIEYLALTTLLPAKYS